MIYVFMPSTDYDGTNYLIGYDTIALAERAIVQYIAQSSDANDPFVPKIKDFTVIDGKKLQLIEEKVVTKIKITK